MNSDKTFRTAIEPWLSVDSTKKAVEFYKAAFGAIETYRMEDPDGNAVVRLSVDDARFWLSDSSSTSSNSPLNYDGNIRLILIVQNPDKIFAQALQAGATEVFPVGEEYGWRLGRLVDPFGLHWEIGKPLE
jgi:PhnB protein